MITLKNRDEIEIMKKGGMILKKILNQLASKVKPGVNCQDLEKIAKKLIRDFGAVPSFYRYRGFPATTCISINEVIVHGIPQNRILKKGDIVSIDIGIKYLGFHTDSAVTVPVGKIKPEHQKLISKTKKALSKAILKTRPGNHISDLSHIIEKTIRSGGFKPIKECSGHGVGRNLHEDPSIPNFGKPGQGEIIKPGMTFAIEPMAAEKEADVIIGKDGWAVKTSDGGYAAHFEHTVAVTPKGALILT